MLEARDHGGGLDVAISNYGGTREQWLDLSTGINSSSYTIPKIPKHFWNSLPDSKAQKELLIQAGEFWNMPNNSNIMAASGVSQLIAVLPNLLPANRVRIISPTYNEHAAAFRSNGWKVGDTGNVQVIVNPNNPDGLYHSISEEDTKNFDLNIIDESFCDISPEKSLIHLAKKDNVIILKGLGKFWGLAGLRLGFAVAAPKLIQDIINHVGPWAVSGPAQFIGKAALSDIDWIKNTRIRLEKDSINLDKLMSNHDMKPLGGTDLFRLYQVKNAHQIQTKLAKSFIWTRVFPYSENWIRLGIPGNKLDWLRLAKALEA
tara:strand:- start:9187 stop:10137 length:951 start_codon:yes stop_codon:yes gene_type:complete